MSCYTSHNQRTYFWLLALITCALAAIIGAMIWNAWMPCDFSQSSALKLTGLNFLLSTGSGFVAALLLTQGEISHVGVVPVTARVGLHSGMTATLVGAGAILVMSVIRAIHASTRTEDMMQRALTWHTALVLLFAFFTSVPAGIIGSMAGLALRRPEIAKAMFAKVFNFPSIATKEAERPTTDWSIWVTRCLIALGITGMLSPLLLLFRGVKVDSPSVVVSSTPPPTPQPRPFRYTKPENFEQAEAGQFMVYARKNIPEALGDSPMLFAIDSRLLAYCPANSNHATVSVVNVDTLDEIATFVLGRTPEQLAWSPDAKSLFYVSRDNEGRMGILNLQNSRSIELPQPKNRELPSGQVAWHSSEEVTFYPKDESPLSLDLDTLQLQTLNHSLAYRDADASLKTKMKTAPGFDFPINDGWAMRPDWVMQNVQPPLRKGQDKEWNVSGFVTLVFNQKGRQSKQWMPLIALQPGDILLPAPDGSKLLHHHGGQTEIIYFSTRQKVPSLLSVQMPPEREQTRHDEKFANLVKEHRLCAIAYAPVINPLNGKTVGPDREHVRAILRVIKWDGDAAVFWVAEQLYDIQPGDVVADLHTWDSGNMIPMKNYVPTGWWELFEEILPGDMDSIPTPTDASDLPKPLTPEVTRLSYVFQLQGIKQSENKPPPSLDSMSAPIRIFVDEHHRKASMGNLNGLKVDYDDPVRYLGDFMVPGGVCKLEEEYHRKWNKVTEVVEGSLDIRRAGTSYEVRYTVAFRTESMAENRFVEGKNDIFLLINYKAGGFYISEQSGTVHDSRVGTLGLATARAPAALPLKKTGPPPVAITVEKPCWMGTVTGEKGGLVSDVTDAIHFQHNGAYLHRTFRVLDADGKVIKSVRAEYHGEVTNAGGALQVYIGQQSWGRDSDSELLRQLSPSVTSAVGQTLVFVIQGNNLVEQSTGEVLTHKN